ncbi:hypothetical protein BDR03DRAFT_872734 [Suillus americanus]|nr:hypothetical protein BDR03DRAFT_872734 [Suillus americanus]
MTFLPLTILLLLHIPFVCSSLPSLNGTSVTILDVSDSPSSNNTRSLWDIIWSCAATLFACTWTAIHPNIPGMDEGNFAVFSRRLGIMTMALIAPELMITWATVQFLSAQWTVTHGFFAWMGGYMLYVNDVPRATLRPNELERFVREGSVEMPVIMKADIEDRSKGDALSKGVAIIQLGWFVLQLVVRYVQNLPMTLLELETLAVAALTCIAYGFWWKKPKDVGRPYVVYWKATTSPPSELAYEYVVNILARNRSNSYVYSLPGLMGVGIFNSPHAVHSRRVPSIGGYDVDSAHRHRIVVLFIGCFSGAVFGGIHCLGWNIFFQGHTEQILWRAASLAIVFAPLAIFLLNGYAIWLGHFWLDHFRMNRSWRDHWNNLGEDIAFLAVLISLLMYIVGRFTLLVLILMSFQSLGDPGIYDTVAWTDFIPHL